MESKENVYSVSKETAALLDCYRYANELYQQVRKSVFALYNDDENGEKCAEEKFGKFETPMMNAIGILKEYVTNQIDEALIFGGASTI